MIYNLILNMLDMHPSSDVNAGKFIFCVDWTFLPEGKKYLMKFKYQCTGANSRVAVYDRLYGFNFTNVLKNVATDGKYNGTTSLVGGAYYEVGNFASDLNNVVIKPDDNTPVMLMDRPTDNFLYFNIWRNANVKGFPTSTDPYTGTALSSDPFILILSFDDDVE